MKSTALVKNKKYAIHNIDSTIILQKPKLAPYISKMRKNISEILSININCVSVKATTTDNLGFIGGGKGISATAIVLLKK